MGWSGAPSGQDRANDHPPRDQLSDRRSTKATPRKASPKPNGTNAKASPEADRKWSPRGSGRQPRGANLPPLVALPVMPKMPAGVGRPTECTPEAMEEFCRCISIGMTVKGAAALAGFAYSLVHNWLERGEANEEPFAEFSRQYRRAQATAEEFHTRSLTVAASVPRSDGPDTRGSCWWLERVRNAEYGQKTKLEMTGPNGGPMQTQTVPLDRKEAEDRILAAAVEIAERRKAEGTG